MADSGSESTTAPRRVPSLAVWVAAGLVAVVGLLMALGSTLLFGAADRAAIGRMVRSGEVQTEGLTDAQAVDLLVAMAQWSGIALLATGALFLLAGLGFAYRYRGRRRETDEDTRVLGTWGLATLGAFVTILLSFLPVSPAFGGGVAGYYGGSSTTQGAKLGGLSGLLAAIPLAIGLGLFAVGLVLGMPDNMLVDARGVVAVSMVVAVLFTVVVSVAFSAIGGVIGVYLGRD
jgi:hypothetical protein